MEDKKCQDCTRRQKYGKCTIDGVTVHVPRKINLDTGCSPAKNCPAFKRRK